MSRIVRPRLYALGTLLAFLVGAAQSVPAVAADTTLTSVLSPECTGGGFVPLLSDAQQAAQLMAGRLAIAPFPTVALAERPTWHENPAKNRNWAYQYQSLRWLDPLRREAVRTGNTAMRNRYLFLLHDWLSKNPFNKRATEDPMAWYDMGIGVRATVLVCAAQVATGDTWLRNAMTNHAAALSDPHVYRTIGNHGLAQDMGLLGLGCVSGTKSWQDLAVKRIAALADRSIDSQGVTDEGSAMYQYFNYVWYGETRQRLKDCNRAIPADLARVDLMPSFLAQATMPNGQVVGFGDSNPVFSVRSIAGTTQQYAATLGASGPRPKQTFSIFSRGYLFSRSTWAPNRPDSSFMSLRFGQSRNEQVHGHNDATEVTFYALGKELLWNNGLWGARGGAFRSYVLGRAAQNAIDVPAVPYNPNAHSPLLRSKSTSSYDFATVTSPVLVGVTTQRTVLHAKVGGFLVVDDLVTQAKSRTVVQRWQLAEGRTTFVTTARVSTSGSGTNATLMWVGTHPHLRVVKGQTKPTVVGWRSDRSNQIVPSPTVEASVNGKRVRLTMVLVPRSSSTRGSKIKISHVHNTTTTRQFDVTTATGTYHVRISATSASVVKL
jgi:hypothetical protein